MQCIKKSFKSYGPYNINLKGFLAMKTLNFDHKHLPTLLDPKTHLHNVLVSNYAIKIGGSDNPPYGI